MSLISRSRVLLRGVGAAVTAAALALAVGCGSSSPHKSGTTTASGPQRVEVSLTERGCAPATVHVHPGPVTIVVTNPGTAGLSELELKNKAGLIVGERENVTSGLSGSFTVEVQPGQYTLNCPKSGLEDNGALIVAGTEAHSAGASDPLERAAVEGYERFVQQEANALVAGTNLFVSAIEHHRLARAKALFGPVRRHYESIEPVAESFGKLDAEIDARVNDIGPGEEWMGFHHIEEVLWVRDTTLGAIDLARHLQYNVKTLDTEVKGLTFQAPQLANGAVELLNEIASSKITGEEDRYSHTDLSDFQGNLNGSRVAFELLARPLVRRGEGPLVQQIGQRFAAVQATLDRYIRKTPLGMAKYNELTAADKRRLSAEIDAVAEPLSTVAVRLTEAP